MPIVNISNVEKTRQRLEMVYCTPAEDGIYTLTISRTVSAVGAITRMATN